VWGVVAGVLGVGGGAIMGETNMGEAEGLLRDLRVLAGDEPAEFGIWSDPGAAVQKLFPALAFLVEREIGRMKEGDLLDYHDVLRSMPPL